MTAYSQVLKTGRFNTELSSLYAPRFPDPKKRAIIFAHGANGSGNQIADSGGQPSLTKLHSIFAQAGFVILSSDWGGAQTYGNDTELAAMEAGWAYLQASGMCKTDKVILHGASMGTLSTHRFLKEHPTLVAGVTCWIPFVDIEAGRTNDWLSLRENINTAWGLPAGSYIGSATDQTPVPVNGRPLDYAASLAAVPTHMWYSTGDVISTNMDAYISARGGAATGHITSTVATHSDAAIAPTDANAVLAFLNSVAT